MGLELRYTIPGQEQRIVTLDQPTMMVGTLLSNQIVVRAPGIDPIHAVIEETEEGVWTVTDVGSDAGVKVNGSIIEVEAPIKVGDSIGMGSIVLDVAEAVEPVVEEKPAAVAPPPPMATTEAATGAAPEQPVPAKTVKVTPEKQAEQRAQVTQAPKSAVDAEPISRREVLFSPRKARPSGDVLEVVAYWGDTVLEVELFHPTIKDYENVTIGDPTKAHFIAAGKGHFDSFKLASVREKGYKLFLNSGMTARLRKGGKVEKVEKGSFSLGRRDIAHVKYGAVRYFMLFVRPPSLRLPKAGPKDPFFMGLMSVAMLLYFLVVPVAWIHNPDPKEDEKDDIWSIVQVPEKEKPPEKVHVKKPKVKIAEKKKPPVKKKPPKPKPKPIKPAKPIEKEKVKQPKPVKKPVPMKKQTSVLTQNKSKPSKNKVRAPKKPKSRAKAGSVGMPSTGAKAPNFKLAGPKLKGLKRGASGGPRGSGMRQKGGARKGKGRYSVRGVEGVKNKKASGVNLSKLGLGVGKIMSKTGAGAIRTNFKSSAGGAGGGSGHAAKTYGLGGVGNGKSLGIAGAGGGLNKWGSGSGGVLSGQGGSGGLGGSGMGKAFGGGKGGRGRTGVIVPGGDPVTSGGLSQQEIMAVIRANLNQIRHCYEQLLQRSPNAKGRVKVKFVIGATGRVSTVAVTQSTIRDSRMRGCITGAVRRWKFPKPRGASKVDVSYPFLFNPI